MGQEHCQKGEEVNKAVESNEIIKEELQKEVVRKINLEF